MIASTLKKLKCPACSEALGLEATRTQSHGGQEDILFGSLPCTGCDQVYPILAGVAVLVVDVESYLLHHVKGISRSVADEDLPDEYRDAMIETRSELETEHIEDDLESERVNALYLATHFLKASDLTAGQESGLMNELVSKYWDQGPFSKIGNWVRALPEKQDAFEFGCGVGGLALVLGPMLKSYLGVDSAFASIALARKWIVGREKLANFPIPGDLLNGIVSRGMHASLNPIAASVAEIDFVVGDVESNPIRDGIADLTLSLNMIDMLGDPFSLPRLQMDVLKPGGVAIQSSPYVWHNLQARLIQSACPREIQDSASAVEWMYRQAGFNLEKREDQVPWLFLKHHRQLEIYFVHMLLATKLR